MATINVADIVYVDAAIASMVVSASVNGAGQLVLTREDTSTFIAGDFNTAITALINTVLASATLLNILISPSVAGNVALKTKGVAAQTGDLQQWLNSANTVLARIKADGTLAAVLNGSTIDGALNTLTNINASEIDSSKVTVNTTAPSSPAVNDIWINPAGT